MNHCRIYLNHSRTQYLALYIQLLGLLITTLDRIEHSRLSKHDARLPENFDVVNTFACKTFLQPPRNRLRLVAGVTPNIDNRQTLDYIYVLILERIIPYIDIRDTLFYVERIEILALYFEVRETLYSL